MIILFTNVSRIWALLSLVVLLVLPSHIYANTSGLKLKDLSLVQVEQLELDDLGKIYVATLRERSVYYNQIVRLAEDLPPQRYGLSEAEVFAFFDYTLGGYEEINKSLWNGNLNIEQTAYIRILDGALKKLPSWERKVYRGTRAFEPLTVGQTIEFKAYSSTSAQERFGKSFVKDRFFIINTSSGKNISQFSYYSESEAEILIPRNIFFRVDKISIEKWDKLSVEVVEITELK